MNIYTDTTQENKSQAIANSLSAQGRSDKPPINLARAETVQKKENNTGLPDNLKTGVENLSGYSMDDVRVHYNSDNPSRLQAHAYAQGPDIHIAPGQEKHLPHEAWHVVQQKQGRVKPTRQMKGEVNINDDRELENEADVMGAKSSQFIAHRFEARKVVKSEQLTQDTSQLVRLIGKITLGSEASPSNTNQVVQLLKGQVICDVGPDPYIYSAEIDRSYDIPEAVDLKFGDVITFNINESDKVVAESIKVTSNYIPPQEVVQEEDYAAFARIQLENRATVMAAAGLAIERINRVIDNSGEFEKNLAAIQKYLSNKAQNYDEGHFLCSPAKDGPVSELAHSKSDGTIELFKGFFNSSATVKADLLVHEAVHSIFKVPDYAYIWQPVIKYLPLQVRLKNPDSYVALIRGILTEEVQTPTLDEKPEFNLALSMIQHVAMRSNGLMQQCQNQLDSFDNQDLGQPLSLLKAFRNTYNKEQMTSLIKICITCSEMLNGLVMGKKIKIVTKQPIPTKTDDAVCIKNEENFTIDFIQPEKHSPYIALMAKIIQTNGLEKSRASAVVLSMDHMVSKNLVNPNSITL